jgi:hypothetical protein
MNVSFLKGGIITPAQLPIFTKPSPSFALSFDGSNLVRVPYSPKFYPESAFTVELWLKTSSTPPNNGVIGTEAGGVNGWVMMGAQGDDWAFYFGANGQFAHIGNATIFDNNWHHVAGIWNGTKVKIFLDGVEGYEDNLGGFINNNSELQIGRYSTNGHPWVIDSVRMSDIVRYTTNFTPSTNWNVDANTILYFSFNEGTGITCADGSPNAFVGTLADGGGGLPIWVPGQ